MLRCMEITEAQYQHIASTLPRQRANVKVNNVQLLNALLYVAEHGCKWRGQPKRFGPWHSIYTRMNRWCKNGVLGRVFEQLQLHSSFEPVPADTRAPAREAVVVPCLVPCCLPKSRSYQGAPPHWPCYA